ncbi:MAG: AMP-binding protein, partial [Bacteroidota bacterium]
MLKRNIPTVIEKFYHWEKTTPDKIFLRQPKGDDWMTLSFREVGHEARKMTKALRLKGLKEGDHVAIYSKNCYHWILADLAIMMGGFVSVPLYASLHKDGFKEVLDIADLKAIFLGKLDDWGDRSEVIPSEVLAIKFPHYENNAVVTTGLEWNEFIEEVDPATDNFIPSLDDLWTIKFTSGTTGTPKGVMHVHRSPSLTMIQEEETNFVGLYKLPEVRTFSYLPLNHVGERIGIELPSIWFGGTISFAESTDTFAKNLQDTQPTLFFSVPRLWNKFYLAVVEKIPRERLYFLLKLPIISTILKKKIRKGLGMSKVQVVGTGAAITPAFIKEFYKKLDIHLIEAYGMTEVCGCITYGIENTPEDSVGRVIPYGEVKVDDETGEVLMKTPFIMKGYYKDEVKTSSVLKDGWMHSGDKGLIDDQGNLKIIGRINDAFKTSKGSYVTPNPMEEIILQNDFIEQVCVVGLGIPQPIAMINLSEMGIKEDQLIAETSILQSIDIANKGRGNFEHISTVVVIKEPWTVENNLLTPTLKVKRQEMDRK